MIEFGFSTPTGCGGWISYRHVSIAQLSRNGEKPLVYHGRCLQEWQPDGCLGQF